MQGRQPAIPGCATWVSRRRASWARHNSANRSGCPMARYTTPSHASMPYGSASRLLPRTIWPASAIADSRLDPSGRVAQRRNHVQERQPRVVDRAGGLDQLFSPGYRLIIFDPYAEQPRIAGDGGGDIQIAVVGGPAERGAQIGQLDGEPVVGRTLAGAVPQGQDVGFAPGEVARVGGPNLGCFTAGDELLLGELADRLQHRKPGPPRRPVSDQQRLAHQRIEQIKDRVVVGVVGSDYRAGAVEIKSPGEHRTPLQQRLLSVGEQVVRPSDGVAQGLVAFQIRAATRPATGTGDRDDHAPRWPSSTPSARPPARWLTECRRVCGRFPLQRPPRRDGPARSPTRHCGHGRRKGSRRRIRFRS